MSPRQRALEALRDELNAQHAGEPDLRSPAAFFVSLANRERLSRRAALAADEAR